MSQSKRASSILKGYDNAARMLKQIEEDQAAARKLLAGRPKRNIKLRAAVSVVMSEAVQ
jgi:hypothetical protein